MNKKVLSSLLVAALLCQQSLFIPVFAGEISGITPVNRVYNIEGEKFSGSTQFRHYDKFNLDKDDVANLIYRQGYDKFINLVNNQVNIKGLLNTIQNGAFYNGHAIFVSPNGIVIGASGVLNVGALSLLTPTQSTYNKFLEGYNSSDLTRMEFGTKNYNSLIDDSTGKITVNGKIISRGDVNLYGSEIEVKGTDGNKAGIVAGLQDDDTLLSTDNQAQAWFNTIVKNNITDADTLTLSDGKLSIVANNSQEVEKAYTYDYEDKIESSVDIDNSLIAASDIEITADAENKIEIGLDGSPIGIVQDFMDSYKGDESGIEDWVVSYLTSYLGTKYTGIEANAKVNVNNSSIISAADTNISANATSSMDLSSGDYTTWYGLLHLIGSNAYADAIIENSTVKTDGELNLKAYTNNKSSADIDNYLFFQDINKAPISVTFINNVLNSKTNAIIRNSEVESGSTKVSAIALSSATTKASSTASTDKDGEYPSWTKLALPLSGALVTDNVTTTAKIENSTVTATTGNVDVLAQTGHISKAKASTKNNNKAFWTSPIKSLAEYLDSNKLTDNMVSKLLSKIYDFEKLKTGLDGDWTRLSGSLDIANNTTTNTASIVGSTINAKKDVNVISNIVDLTVNNTSNLSIGKGTFGAGLALIVNNQTNNNYATIDNSNVTAVGDINVLSTTHLPYNKWDIHFSANLKDKDEYGSVELGYNLFSKDATYSSDLFNIMFSSGKVDDLSNSLGNALKFGGTLIYDVAQRMKDFSDDQGNVDWSKMWPEINVYLSDFFNNWSSSVGAMTKNTAEGSIVYNSVTNNSIANVLNNSNLNANNVNLNAVNYVTQYNAAGQADVLFQAINTLVSTYITHYNKNTLNPVTAKGFGFGASVLIDNYNDNAKSYVKDSTVTAKDDVNLNASNTRDYISVNLMPAKSGSMSISGSVTTNIINGETLAQIINSEVGGNNINLEAGKAKIKLSDKKPSIDKKTGELKLDSKETELNDGISNIVLSAAVANQGKEGDAKSDAGTSAGASVVYSEINTKTNSKISGSTITASNNLTTDAHSTVVNMDFALAGAYTGGVSMKKPSAAAGSNPVQNAVNNAVNQANNINDSASNDNDDSVIDLRWLFDQDAQDALNNSNASNASNVANNNANNIAQGAANAQEASKNLSLALAGAVNVVTDNSSVSSAIEDSTVNVGNNLEVTSLNRGGTYDFTLGYAISGQVGAGAAVNAVKKSGITESAIKNSTVNFINNGEHNLLVNSNVDAKLLNVAVGFGANYSSETEHKTAFATGDSFNISLADSTSSAKIEGSHIYDASNVTVNADNYTKFVNAGGGVVYQSGQQSTNVGVGVTSNTLSSQKTTTAQISGSDITSIGDVKVTTNTQKDKDGNKKSTESFFSVGAGANVNTGSGSAYNFDGALGVNVLRNTVLAEIANTNIQTTGDIAVNAYSNLYNLSSTNALSFSSSTGGFGAGLGAIVNVDSNNIQAKVTDSTINSNSLDANSRYDEDSMLIAMNMGIQTGKNTGTIKLNGIVNVQNSLVVSSIINSTLESGNISNTALNQVKLNDITGAAVAGQSNVEVAGNAIINVINSETKSIIENDAQHKIASSGNITNSAQSSQDLIVTPVGVSAGTGTAVGANVVVNVNNSKAVSNLTSDISNANDIIANAINDTFIVSRGGTLAGTTGTAAVGGIVNVDVLNKTVEAFIKDSEITSNGDVLVSASAKNAFGGTKTGNTYSATEVNTDNIKNQIGSDIGSSFADWEMFYNLAGSTSSAAVSGTVVVKVINDEVKASIDNAKISSSSLTVNSKNDTVLNAVVGNIAGSSNTAVGSNVLVTVAKDKSTAEIINGSQITTTGNVNVNSETINKQNVINVLGTGSGTTSVNAGANVNVLKSETNATVSDSSVTANNNIEVLAKGTTKNLGVEVSIAGAGTTALGGALIWNDLTNTINSEVNNSTLTSNKLTLKSDDNIDTQSYLVGISAAGTAGISAYGFVNNVSDLNKAKIDNSTITSALSTEVLANSDYILKESFTSAAFSGTASVAANVLVNTIDSSTSAYIDNSTIKGGSIKVNANRKSDIFTNNNVLTISGVANVGAGVITNILKDNLNAYINNSILSDVGAIDVIANSNNKLQNYMFAIGLSPTASVGASVLYNSINNNVNSYINLQDKTAASSGKVTIKSTNNTELENILAKADASIAAVGAIVNYSVVNDSTTAQILGGVNRGVLTAKGVNVLADSTIGLNSTSASAVGGIAGVAGNVSILTLGDNIDLSSLDSGLRVSEALNAAKTSLNTNKHTKNIDLKTSNSKEGTLAKISAKIDNTGSNINVKATNKLKGLGSSGYAQIDNGQASIGGGTVGVGYLLAQMKYKTTASVENSDIKTQNLAIEAKDTVKANVNAIDANLSGINLSGAVALFDENSQTTAKLDSSKIETSDLSLKSGVTDDITTSAIAAYISGVTFSANVSDTKARNVVQSLITGNNNITTDNLDIATTIKQDLSSSLRLYGASILNGAYTANNASTAANAIAQMSGSGDINVNNGVNIGVYNDNINVTNNVYSGIVTGIKAGYEEQKATINTNFISGIDSSALNINSENADVKILTGVNSTNKEQSGKLNAKISTKGGGANVVAATYNHEVAEVSANSTTNVNANLKAKSLTVKSKLDRNADVSKNDVSISAISVAGLKAESKISGSDVVNVGKTGSNLAVTNAILAELSDVSNSYATMDTVNIGVVNANYNSVISDVSTNTDINVAGTIDAGTITVNNNVSRTSKSDISKTNVSLVDGAGLNTTSNVTGNSNVTYSAQTPIGSALNNALAINSSANNKVYSDMGSNKVALVALSHGSLNTKLDTSNKIIFNNAKVESKGDFNIGVSNENGLLVNNSTGAYGLVSIATSGMERDITTNAGVEFNNSTINAKNINILSNAKTTSLGQTLNYDTNLGSIFYSGGTPSLTSTIKQKNTVSLKNSNIKTREDLKVNLNTDTDYKQSVTNDTGSFIDSPGAKSILSVQNDNKLVFDNSTAQGGKNVKINLDSSNTLTSKAVADSGGFTAYPDSTAGLALYIDNAINLNNSSTISSGADIDIDYLRNSSNYLTQYSFIKSEGALAGGSAIGTIIHSRSNGMNVGKGSQVKANKNIDIVYSNTNNYLNSKNEYDKTSRIALGIPIHRHDSSSNIVRAGVNELKLDGDLIAGNGTAKSMVIDKDGNIIKSEGFTEGVDYTIDSSISPEAIAENIKKLELDLENDKGILNVLESLDYENLIASEREKNNKDITAINEIFELVKSPDNVIFAGDLKEGETYNITTKSIGSESVKLEISMCEGKAIFEDEAAYNDYLTSMNKTLEQVKAYAGELDGYLKQYNQLVANYKSDISNLEGVIANLKNAQTSTTEFNHYITFNDIISNAYHINISNLDVLNGTTGKMVTLSPSLDIENYSSYNLVFNSILMDSSAQSGVIINGNSYNTNGKIGFYPSLKHNVQRVNGGNDTKFAINTYYDHNNPLLNDHSVSNMTFLGNFSNPSIAAQILNESGNIKFNKLANGVFDNLVASQGNINIADGTNITVNKNMFAGKDINVKSANFKNNGKVRAGNNNRNLTITDDILGTLKLDNNNVSSMNKENGNLSVYMNDKNNVKAFIDKDGKIQLFNTQASNGSVNIEANKSGSGTYFSAGDDTKITIDNSGTLKEAIINNLEANIINVANNSTGTTTVNGALTATNGNIAITAANGKIDVTNTNGSLAVSNSATLNANGNINILNSGNSANIAGSITTTNGNAKIETTNGTLTISDVLNLSNTGGVTNITSTNDGQLVIAEIAKITSNEGDLSIANSTSNNLVIPNGAVITNNNGATNITNNGASSLTIAGTIDNKNGATNIATGNTSDSLQITEDAIISNNNGNITIDNQSVNSSVIAGAISNEIGQIDITNSNGALELASTSKIELNKQSAEELKASGQTTDYNITINNEKGADALTISGFIKDYAKGDIKINDLGEKDLIFTKTAQLNNVDGNIEIYNEEGKLDFAGQIENTEGFIALVNFGDGGLHTALGSAIYNNNGVLTLANYSKGDMNIEGEVYSVGNVLNIINSGEGNLTLSNDTILGDLGTHIYNDGLGDIIIDNYNYNENETTQFIQNSDKGGIIVTANGYIDNKNGNVEIINNGQNGISIYGTIANTDGYIDIENNGNGLLYIDEKALISNIGSKESTDDYIRITNNNSIGAIINGEIQNELGDIEIINNAGFLEILDDANIVLNANNPDATNTIKIVNNKDAGTLFVDGHINNAGNGDLIIDNYGTLSKSTSEYEQSGFTIDDQAWLQTNNGKIALTNHNSGVLSINGHITNRNGESVIDNQATDGGIEINYPAFIKNYNGDFAISNTGKEGIKITALLDVYEGDINITNKNSDIVIGSIENLSPYTLMTDNGNINITQKSGNIINGVIDPDGSAKHQNYDLAKREDTYKTLIYAKGNLNLNVENGNIGVISNSASSIEASTRDWTDSINVNVQGKITANADNINLRAVESDMNIDKITANGDVLLTAADWKQADLENPIGEGSEYFNGYSITGGTVEGQNMSIISSNNVGLSYIQRLDQNPDATINVEAENNIDLVALKSDYGTNIGKIISKQGKTNITLNSDTVIEEITGKNLHIQQNAKNLTIKNLGTSSSEGYEFDDILYPHDKNKLKGSEGTIPETVAIEVLDAYNTNGNSTLTILNANLTGANNGAGPDGFNGNLGDTLAKADVTLMADNIYAKSGNGATGFNKVGDGASLTFDITGVNKEYVASSVKDAVRTNYTPVQNSIDTAFSNIYANSAANSYMANSVSLSVNNAAENNTGVYINKLYANNANIDTKDTNLTIKDAIIAHHGEFSNNSYKAVVENDIRKLIASDAELYTEKTGSFYLGLNKNINILTSAPVINFNPDRTVNGYHSENSFYNLTYKDNKGRIDRAFGKKEYKNEPAMKRVSLRFNVENDEQLVSNVQIIDISTTGAKIVNNGYKQGDIIDLSLKYKDIEDTVKSKVVQIDKNTVGVRFLDIKKETANKILYELLKRNKNGELQLTEAK